MSGAKKAFIYLCVCLFLGVFALGLWWARTRTEREMRQDLLAQVASLEALVSRSHEENVALLSIKYGIDPARLEGILDSYLCQHDVVYRMKKGITRESIAPNLAFGATLDNLSVQQGIPRERLAALITDYKILSRLDRDDAIDRRLARGAKQSMMKGAFAGARRLFGE